MNEAGTPEAGSIPVPDLTASLGRPPRVLVTGAGGPSGICFLRSLAEHCELFAGDVDPNGAGLYLVDRQHRWLLPRGDAGGFAGTLLGLCARLKIDVLVPTVDAELLPLAEIREGFESAGVRLLLSPVEALRSCLDKWNLARACSGAVRVPDAVPLGPAAADDFTGGFPAIAKPRNGSGSRGIVTVMSTSDLATLPNDASYLLQEILPGVEYSVDVLARGDGGVVAAVPRSRDKTDSGIVVASRVLDREPLSATAAAVVGALGLRGVLNVQLREDGAGTPALLEVNPRPPGGMSLTIASGVHMPAWAVAELLGQRPPDHLPHQQRSVVRHWQDIVLPPDELGKVEGHA
ncbi:carbamoyl-phosphate synthase large subunit [Actinopolyspora lacussalsi subsp. righensis]|uniref:Carbamoyl-phosphate synthase large subunit n=1 Tax=Actinopolyspora righensis TaxID=995060 RepID=A0A1I6X6H0_9ACTN|nr:ATP-grasp domain-containing protein [Actinopolyspora righensis]SFT33823.1 carbamoyl-phosphate synthase large subunit [Actinopolyspora righensis]